MSSIPLFSNRRPLKHRFFLACTLLLLLAGPVTMQQYVNIGVGGVFEVNVANGLVQLNAPAVRSSEFRIESGGDLDGTIGMYGSFLVPQFEWFGGLHVQIPSWILMCIAYLLYRRTRRNYEAAIEDAGWCRSCGTNLKAPDALRCDKCGHDARLCNRVSFVRWIASGMRQDVVFVGGRGNVAFRAILATLIFIAIFGSTVYFRFIDSAIGSFSEFLSRTIPSFDLFVLLFVVTFLAWVLTRLVLVMLFFDRRFASPPSTCARIRHSSYASH